MNQNEKHCGSTLPQNSPELELFVKAQAHIREAIKLVDEINVIKLPQLQKKQQDIFKNLADEVRSVLWEVDSNVQDLTSAYLIPLYPISDDKK